MYKKNIKHLATISLKYFFDFDYSVFDFFVLVIISLIHSFKIIILAIANEFYDSAITVKEDMYEIKTGIITYKERWDNSGTRAAIVNNIRSLSSFMDKEKFTWRL